MPERAPAFAAAGCTIPEGTIVHCNMTNEYSKIRNGQRHVFSPEVYSAWCQPTPTFYDKTPCLRSLDCPVDRPMRKPSRKDAPLVMRASSISDWAS